MALADASRFVPGKPRRSARGPASLFPRPRRRPWIVLYAPEDRAECKSERCANEQNDPAHRVHADDNCVLVGRADHDVRRSSGRGSAVAAGTEFAM